MKRATSLGLALLTLLTFSPQAAQARGPSTPEERAKAVEAVRKLEADLTRNDAKELRAWMLVFLTEVPDLVVEMCPDLLGAEFDISKKYGGELAMQQGFAAAAFLIEHPDLANDKAAVRLASVEGVLRTYENLLAKKPKAAQPALANLLKARADGTLASLVAANAKTCS